MDSDLKRYKAHIGGCGGCICQSCFKYIQGKCPYGGCYDSWRVKHEQRQWCRGGICYEAAACDEYIEYTGIEIKYCLNETITVYQDGSIRCTLVDNMGCEECYRQFEERQAYGQHTDTT